MKRTIAFLAAIAAIPALGFVSLAAEDAGSGELDSGTLRTILVVAVIAIIVAAYLIYVVMMKKKKEYVRHVSRRVTNTDRQTSVTEMRPVDEYAAVDPDFDEGEFRAMVSDLFVRLCECRTKKDVEPLRPYMSDDLCDHFAEEITNQGDKKRTAHFENVTVKEVVLRGCKPGRNHYHLIMRVEASMLEYTTNDKNGRVVSGSDKEETEKKYEWDMRRRKEPGDDDRYPGKGWNLCAIKSLDDPGKK